MSGVTDATDRERQFAELRRLAKQAQATGQSLTVTPAVAFEIADQLERLANRMADQRSRLEAAEADAVARADNEHRLLLRVDDLETSLVAAEADARQAKERLWAAAEFWDVGQYEDMEDILRAAGRA